MGFLPLMDYIISYVMFGFVYWLLGGIVGFLFSLGIHDTTGSVGNLLSYYWSGLVVVFIVFSSIWIIRKYNEREYSRGF